MIQPSVLHNDRFYGHSEESIIRTVGSCGMEVWGGFEVRGGFEEVWGVSMDRSTRDTTVDQVHILCQIVHTGPVPSSTLSDVDTKRLICVL